MRFIKPLIIAEEIIFVDGLWGTGKSIMGPVLGSFERVEKQKLDPIYEHLSVLDRFGKIDPDSGEAMMRLYADIALFNSMISREVNLRPFDESGLLNNPRPLEYMARLLYKDGDAVMERIREKRPILQIMTHQILPAARLAFRSFGERFRIIEMVRHPLYMAQHWFSYIERCGRDPREFTLWIEDGSGPPLPWFSSGWEERYSSLSTMDKVIYSIKWLYEESEKALGGLSEGERSRVFLIPFERFVKDPWHFIGKLKAFLGVNPTERTKRVLRKQKCPRANLSAGKGHESYGWSGPLGGDDSEDYSRRMEFVDAKASPEAAAELRRMCGSYEERFKVSIPRRGAEYGA